MKRVAILNVGEMRGYVETFESWKKNLIETNPDCIFDMFVFTSATSVYRDIDPKGTLTTKTDQRQIEELYGDILKDVVVYEEHKDKSKFIGEWFNEICRKCNSERCSIQHALLQWPQVKLAWNIMQEYEISKGIQYDIVVRVRPDMGLQMPVILSKFDLHKIYHVWDGITFSYKSGMEWWSQLMDYVGKIPNPERAADNEDNRRWRYACEILMQLHLKQWAPGAVQLPLDYIYIRKRFHLMSGQNNRYVFIKAPSNV